MTIPATTPGAIVVQYYDEATAAWVQFGDAVSLNATGANRRIGIAPGQGVTAAKWRVVKTGATDFGFAGCWLGGVKFWREDAASDEDYYAMRGWSFNFDGEDQRYIIAATAGNLEIFRGGARVGSCATPYTAREVVSIGRTQQLDTLICFHEDVKPWRIMRQGTDTDWDSRPVAFDALPIFDYGGSYTNGVDEVQRIIFNTYTAGNTFNITLDEETTDAIEFGGDTAAAIASALAALPSVGAGNVSAAVHSSSDDTVEIDVTFSGKLAGQQMDQMAPVTLDSPIDPSTGQGGYVTCATITQGQAPGEPIISDLRGWPAAGCFHQQRLLMAGLKSRPQTVLGSRVGSYFNFDPKGSGDDTAMNETLAGYEAASALKAIFPGRNLQLFSSSGEFYFPDQAIKPFSPTKQASHRGIQSGTLPQDMDGSTLFIANGGDALVGMAYDFTVDSYSPALLSAFNGHLVNDVRDFTVRKTRSAAQPYIGLLVRWPGTLTALIALPDQQVAAFVPWTTNGAVISVVAEMGGDLYALVDRGNGLRTLERFDATRMLDCSVMGETGTAVQTGLDDWNGHKVTAWVDGDDAGDFIVAEGQITLPRPPVRSCEIGLLFQPQGVTLPGVLQEDPRAGSSMKVRVGEIAFSLGPTANLRAGLVGGKTYRVGPPRASGALPTASPGDAPFEGWARLTGVPGFRDEAQVQWIQTRPGPLEIRELVLTVTS